MPGSQSLAVRVAWPSNSVPERLFVTWEIFHEISDAALHSSPVRDSLESDHAAVAENQDDVT